MSKALDDCFNEQIDFQRKILQKQIKAPAFIPCDSRDDLTYHIQAMVEELGELLAVDKRWKSHRNLTYDVNGKLDEVADILITAFNIAIFSGCDIAQLQKIVSNKIALNFERLEKSEDAFNK